MSGLAASAFGLHLKHFRRLRGLSQLALAHAAGVSPRHISFIETGRSQPSSDMVLRLAESLDVPLREQNDLLRAAGYAPRFPGRAWTAPALLPVRRLVERMLAQHEPFPAFAIDRYWDIVFMNSTAEHLFRPLLTGSTGNAVELFLSEGPVRDIVDNWSEIAWHTLGRLRREAAVVGGDARLSELYGRALALMAGVPPPASLDVEAPVLESRLRLGDHVVKTFTTIASFSAARDVTLDELRVELVFPADEDAEEFFRRLL